MPLRLPDRLPAIDLLKKENIFVMDDTRAHSQDIRPLRIVILNLMPLKITTETDLIRLLSNTPLQLDVSFMKLKSHTPIIGMRLLIFLRGRVRTLRVPYIYVGLHRLDCITIMVCLSIRCR